LLIYTDMILYYIPINDVYTIQAHENIKPDLKIPYHAFTVCKALISYISHSRNVKSLTS